MEIQRARNNNNVIIHAQRRDFPHDGVSPTRNAINVERKTSFAHSVNIVENFLWEGVLKERHMIVFNFPTFFTIFGVSSSVF